MSNSSQTAQSVPADLANHARYEILQLLGQGGMGAVYKARHKVMDRIVALKVINAQLVGNEKAVERFRREVQAAAKLHHANIVTAYDADQAGNTHFLVMEFVEGNDLAQYVAKKGPLPVAHACHFIRQAALGLQHAHERGMVHRDIKPHNLMLTTGGVVKVMDFGLARLAQETSSTGGLTGENAVMGTADYIAPEQAQDARKADIRADIYSLGCSLYHLLAGKPPFAEGNVMQKLANHLGGTFPLAELPVTVPGDLRAVLAKMVEKEPAKRYQTPSEVAQALAPFVQKTTGAKPLSATMALSAAQPREATHNQVSIPLKLPSNHPSETTAEGTAPTPQQGQKGKRAWLIPATIVVAFLVMLLVTTIALLSSQGSRTAAKPGPVAEPSSPPEQNAALPAKFANSLGMEFVLVGKGKFPMGGGGGTVGNKEVVIPYDFYLGTYEVTQEQWQTLMGSTPSYFSRTGDGKDLVKAIPNEALRRFPVEQVSWYNAQHFLDLLNAREKEEGWVYRLPKETEWEYACRGGPSANKFDFAFDFYFDKPTNQCLPNQANFLHEKSLKRTCPVGSYKPNPLGLYDLHGNVWEWCDGEQRQPEQARPRGGAWNNAACSAATSAGPPAIMRQTDIGFRVARVPVGKEPIAAPPPKPPEPVKPVGALPPPYKNGLAMEFVLVGKGTAWLGSIAGAPSEKKVDIPYDFYLGKYEVTQEEWEQVTGLAPSGFSRTGGGKDAVKDIPAADLKRFPVEHVSWEDAQLFLERLNQREKDAGWIYRLPKAAEWEYACRDGPLADKLDSAFDFYVAKPTNQLLLTQANFASEPGKGLQRTCQVGSYQPNRLGLYDMHGNVWEWCDDTEKAPDGASQRVIRGGSWIHDAGNCRAANRAAFPPSDRYLHLGLRLARVPIGKEPVAAPPPKPPEPMKPVGALPPVYKNGLAMEFVLVGKGTAWLGSIAGVPSDKKVEIPHDYYLGKYEVTQEEWEKVTGLTPSHFSRNGPGKDAVKDIPDAELKRFPVSPVSWDDAQVFLERLNKREKDVGWIYRLPKEAEWEYACRGGPQADKFDSAYDFYFDKPTNQLLPDQANFTPQKGMGGLQRTCKVGSYKPNQLGLYDMHGNCLEWCDDSVKGFDGSSHRATRGGGWGCGSEMLRAGYPFALAPSDRNANLGLRVARVPIAKEVK